MGRGRRAIKQLTDLLPSSATVRDGNPLKGMPSWGPQLGATRVQAVTAYVLTLRNTNVPGGKPPQGDKFAQSN